MVANLKALSAAFILSLLSAEASAYDPGNAAYNSYMSNRVAPLTEFKSAHNLANIQKRLMELGYNVGPMGATGVMNNQTVNAVMDFQARNGLRVDGVVGDSTARALNATRVQAYAPVYKDVNAQNIAAIQKALMELGYYIGTQGANGVYNYSTADAVKHFQNLNSLPPTGLADQRTVSLLGAQVYKKRGFMRANGQYATDGANRYSVY